MYSHSASHSGWKNHPCPNREGHPEVQGGCQDDVCHQEAGRQEQLRPPVPAQVDQEADVDGGDPRHTYEQGSRWDGDVMDLGVSEQRDQDDGKD
jgi:hypothetical protein